MSSSNNASTSVRIGRVLRDVRIADVTPTPVSPASTPTGAPASEHSNADVTALRNQAYQEGKLAGYKEAQRELASAVAMLRDAAQGFDREQAKLYGKMDEYLVTLSLAVARKILAREMENPQALNDLLRRALSQTPGGGACRVRMHPEDLRLLESARGKLAESGEILPEEIVLSPDSQIGRGGCIVDSPSGLVDARMETQLAQIGQALLTLKRPEPSPIAGPMPPLPTASPTPTPPVAPGA